MRNMESITISCPGESLGTSLKTGTGSMDETFAGQFNLGDNNNAKVLGKGFILTAKGYRMYDVSNYIVVKALVQYQKPLTERRSNLLTLPFIFGATYLHLLLKYDKFAENVAWIWHHLRQLTSTDILQR